MKFSVAIKDNFHCSLERAFKTPMLCDVTKVHTGLGIMPKIIGVSDDENWGQPDSTKKVYAAKSISQKGGYVSIDKVIERIENERWIIEVSDFQSWMLGFYKFTGTWETKEISPSIIEVNYSYTLHTKTPIYFIFNWLFAKIFWKKYMKQVLSNIKQLAYNDEPYLYP